MPRIRRRRRKVKSLEFGQQPTWPNFSPQIVDNTCYGGGGEGQNRNAGLEETQFKDIQFVKCSHALEQESSICHDIQQPSSSNIPCFNPRSSVSDIASVLTQRTGVVNSYVNKFINLDQFVIIEPKEQVVTAQQTLQRSADLNQIPLEYKCKSDRCILEIDGVVMADVTTVPNVSAKKVASELVLDHLRKFCWVILVKADKNESRISRDEINSETNEKSDILDYGNVGYKMLRKMGWSGGGMGKDGGGIVEPVSLKSVIRREGLGSDGSIGISKEFKKNVKAIIESYASSDNQEEIAFSSEFGPDERKIIHELCTRLKLVSKSRGRGENRYIIVGRKWSLNQLLDYLKAEGGETARYQLMPPGTHVPPSITVSETVPKSVAQVESSGKGVDQGCSQCKSSQAVIQSLESRCAALERRLDELAKQNADVMIKQVRVQEDLEVEEELTTKTKRKKGMIVKDPENLESFSDNGQDLDSEESPPKRRRRRRRRSPEKMPQILVPDKHWKPMSKINNPLSPFTESESDDGISDDIQHLRDEFESNAEWGLRYQFLLSNKDSLPLDRLVCLSRCFVNMAVYNCSYPASVMREVRVRSDGVLDDIEKARQAAA